jgi:hypothetical protein
VQRPGDEALEPEFFEADDRVFVRWRQQATAPGGERLDLPAISEYRLRDGRIVGSSMHHLDPEAILAFLERANPRSQRSRP